MTAHQLGLQFCSIATRYRLSLVREDDAPYGGEELPPPASSPEKTARYLCRLLADEPAECMGVVLLDTKRHPIGHLVLFRGTLNRCAVEPRPILQAALLTNASAVVLFHNHPSGDPTPSAEDILFTRRLTEAVTVVGVDLVDHVIVTADGKWTSLRERGAW